MVKVMAAGTLWVRPEHVGSMATTTTDDILAVYDDGAEDAVVTLKSCAMSLEVMDTGSCAIPAMPDTWSLPGLHRTISRWPQGSGRRLGYTRRGRRAGFFRRRLTTDAAERATRIAVR